MKIFKFLLAAACLLAAGLLMPHRSQATMQIFTPNLEDRINYLGKNGLIIEGTVTDAKMITLDNGWLATECTIKGEVIKGSATVGVPAGASQEVKVRLFGYGNFGIKGMPTCSTGETGLYFFRGPNTTTGLTSFSGGDQGKFSYVTENGVVYASDGYHNMGLQIKNLNKMGKNLSVSSQDPYSAAVKSLATEQSSSGGLPASSLKTVVTDLVHYYYPSGGK